jgi:type I restriction enzyme S subunit
VSDWREVPLGDVLTLQRGFDLPARDRVEGPFPIISSSGVTGRHAVAKVDPPGVVIGRYGSLGSVHGVTEPYWPLNTSLWVKDCKGNDPRVVSYLLRTLKFDGSTASAVPGGEPQPPPHAACPGSTHRVAGEGRGGPRGVR